MTSLVDQLLRSRFESERQELVAGHVAAPARSPAEIRRDRDLRLIDLIGHARASSPYHARRLEGVDLGSLTADDLSALPVMTKAELMAHWDDAVCAPDLDLASADAHLTGMAAEGPGFLRGTYLVFATGGSSGTRGVIPWHWRDLLEAGMCAGRASARLAPPDERMDDRPIRSAGIWADSPLHASAMAGWLQQGFAGAETEGRSAGRPMAELVSWLNAFDPTHLTAYSSALERLTGEAAAGRLRIAPGTVNAIAEPVSDRLRGRVEQQWGARLINLYGCIECPAFAISAPGEVDLHVIEDLAIVEVVDGDHQPVADGVAGECLLLTGLFNRTMPLIRYELHDRVVRRPRRADGGGDCGGTGDELRISPPVGRDDDRFRYPGGVVVHPTPVSTAMLEQPGIVDFQVRQTPTGIDADVCLTSPIAVDRLRRRLGEVLVEAGLVRPDVQVRQVESIARLRHSAKLRQYVALGREG